MKKTESLRPLWPRLKSTHLECWNLEFKSTTEILWTADIIKEPPPGQPHIWNHSRILSISHKVCTSIILIFIISLKVLLNCILQCHAICTYQNGVVMFQEYFCWLNLILYLIDLFNLSMCDFCTERRNRLLIKILPIHFEGKRHLN